MLRIDGTEGEGGGQVLRTALALSIVTATPIHIEGIRGKRKKPGLQRQHLTCVQAAATVSEAEALGSALGSLELKFTPRKARAGNYRFSIGSAGSATLVLQTILPALLAADAPSTVQISGGTHNPMAPPFDFVQQSFATALLRMGARMDVQLLRHGFMPSGGGSIAAKIEPCARYQPIELLSRGEEKAWRARALVSKLPDDLGARQLDALLDRFERKRLKFDATKLERVEADDAGNALLLELPHGDLCDVLCAFGERGMRPEHLADRIATEAMILAAAGVPVGPHLADQLLIAMALAGSGTFRTVQPTLHCTTNARLIERFLPVAFTFAKDDDKGAYRVTCAPRR